MNPINIAGMAGMNAMPGGPVGGVPMMNTASAAPRSEPPMTQESLYIQLNTCIYDYFLKRGQYDAARMLLSDESIKLDTDIDPKTSPGHMNGVDGDTSMGDSKDEKTKIPDEFPRPRLPMDTGNSFLFEWFSLFWDIFAAQRRRGSVNPLAQQYVTSSQGLMRMRETVNQNFLRQPQVLLQNPMAGMRRNGMQNMPPQKTAMLNNAAGMTPQQMAQLQTKQQMQMQREHSGMDLNGHRPQSPSSAENAPSPSKRPRLEGAQAAGQQMAPNGRAQGQMPGQLNAQALLMQNGLNAAAARGMNPTQYQTAFQQQQSGQAAVQQKSMQVYAQNLLNHHSRSALNNQGMPNGLMNNGLMPNQADMMPQLPDGQNGMPMVNGQFYSGDMNMANRQGMATAATAQNGNHALQDYQMQLMLLEQQNKRRLMMARQEQESIPRPDGQPMSGQPGLPPGTSPQGSRAGASPNPSEQMKRGTPKISQTGLPASPSAADLQGRGSPASMNFNAGQMPPDMNNAFLLRPDGMIAPNGMRPPTSNQGFNPQQMNQAMQPGPNARMPGGNWQAQGGPQGQSMVAQQSPATQAAPTPQERNTMPPPSAPPQGGKPASPQQGAAPPTPQQSNKPAPKGKKDTEKNRKRPTKKGAAAANANTAATPSSEAEPPPTPTPSTPITPQHPSSFKNGVNATTASQQQPTSAPAAPIVQQQPDPNVGSFDSMGMPDPSNFSLDFSSLENSEVLENFDFDSFLNTDADATGFGFDPSSITYPTDGVETGTDGL